MIRSIKYSFKAVIFAVFFIVITPKQSHAEDFLVKNYTVYDGLPSSSIHSIHKDSKGLMWFGTDAGLCTYDGSNFAIIKTENGKTINNIWSIAEDESGNLWLASFGGGIYCYNGRNIRKYTTEDGLLDNNVRVISYSNKYDCVVAGSYTGVYIVKNDSLIASPKWMGTKDTMYCCTGIADAGDFVYLSTLGPINPIRCYPDKGEFKSAADNGKNYMPGCMSVYISSQGDTVFAKYPKGIKITDRYGNETFDSDIGQVFSTTEDNEGNLWMASWSYKNRDLAEGIFKFDGHTFKNYNKEFGITDKEVWSTYYDKEQDVLWVGTLNQGLFKIIESDFTRYSSSYFNLENLDINDICVDASNEVWIAGKKEIIRFNQYEYSFLNKRQMLIEYQKLWKQGIKNKLQINIMDSKIRSLQNLDESKMSKELETLNLGFTHVLNDTNNSILFVNRLGVFGYDKTSDSIVYYGFISTAEQVLLGGKDTLIFSGWGPAGYYPSFHDLNNYYNNLIPDESFLMRPSHVLIPFSDEGNPKDVTRMKQNMNQIWFTSWSKGLWLWDENELINVNKYDSAISTNLNDVCFDVEGNVIVGSNDGTIYIGRYHDEELTIKYTINSDNGLMGNTVFWLLADKENRLWVGTNLGLNYIDLNLLYSSSTIENCFINKEEGYNGQSSNKAVVDSAGNLFIGIKDELIKFNTQQFFCSSGGPRNIVLTDLFVNQQKVDSVYSKTQNSNVSVWNGGFRLKFYENDIVFKFHTYNYINPQKDKFRYRLIGYEKEWTDYGSLKQASYTNLPSGKYSFCVESFNQKDNSEAIPLKIDFRIGKAFWEMLWFQILAGLIVIAITILLTKKITNRKRVKQLQQTEIEKKILKLEMQALQAQMNPHFIFNCISGIQYNILANKTDDVLNYLADFSRVVRVSLENATQNMIPIESEIEFLHSYLRLEQMRFKDKFDYNIKIEDGLASKHVQLPPMMVQPFAENSIKHGFSNFDGKGLLLIEFKIVDEAVLKCTVTDNGVGRKENNKNVDCIVDPDRIHSTRISDMRLKLHDQSKFRIEYIDLRDAGKPKGLKVVLYLPMK